MAKIFRTEELSVNGDNIRLAADNNGNLVIKDSSNNVVTSTDIIASDVSSLAVKDVATSSDISSLQSQRVADEAANDNEISSLAFKDLDLDSDISSLVAKDGNVDSDISSLQAQRVADEAETDSDISSLQAQRVADEAANDNEISSLAFKDLDLDSDISSLAAVADANDVRINNVALLASDGDSKSVTFTTAFPSGTTPAVVGLMQAGASDPIIGVQLSAVSETGATFQFSDDIPSDNTYTLVVMASA